MIATRAHSLVLPSTRGVLIISRRTMPVDVRPTPPCPPTCVICNSCSSSSSSVVCPVACGFALSFYTSVRQAAMFCVFKFFTVLFFTVCLWIYAFEMNCHWLINCLIDCVILCPGNVYKSGSMSVHLQQRTLRAWLHRNRRMQDLVRVNIILINGLCNKRRKKIKTRL